MNFLKKIILVLLFLFSISNSFGAMVTHSQTATVSVSAGGIVAGVEFNNDGTKMFTSYGQMNGTAFYIEEYNLSTPYDISTRVSAGDSERCELTGTVADNAFTIYDLEFSSDGMKFFILQRKATNFSSGDRVYGFDLTSSYDVSTCALATSQLALDTTALTNGSQAGDFDHSTSANRHHRVQALEINNDGTKLFLTFMDNANSDVGARLFEYTLSTPYDVSTLSIVTTAGIELPPTTNGVTNPAGMRFSSDGKRIFIISHNDANAGITQISLSKAYDTSSFSIDGGLNINTGISPSNDEPRGVTFSANGLKLYIGNDSNMNSADQIMEYDLVCPFNIIAGKCPPITENNVRTGMAEAQIEIAKRTIDHSTDTALNRLKWIRRNKDKQNLTNFNIDINFTNQRLASLTEVVRTSTAKKKTKDKDKEQDVFYWSEGSVSLGRVGDTSIASTKEAHTNSLTFGFDKFTDDYSLEGFAFRYGNDDVDVGTAGSNLDADTYNITYYSTSPMKDDTKYVDKIFGIGKIRTDILTVLDGKNLTADRTGNQIYGTVKIKDEYKKDNLILIPSGQFDFGHTILNGYQEAGTGAIDVKKQHVRTKKLRAAMAIVEDLSNDKYTFKRHGITKNQPQHIAQMLGRWQPFHDNIYIGH